MVLSAAEKQRRYRRRRDADQLRREEYLAKEKERYKKLREIGIRKSKSEMTKREHRRNRRMWRLQKKDLRKRKKEVRNILTPPESPEPLPQIVEVVDNQPGPSRQHVVSTKKRNRNKSKFYRRNLFLQRKIEEANLRANRYRLRWVRLKEEIKGGIETPRSKTRRLLRKSSSVYVKRALDFHHVLVSQVEKSYKQFKLKKSIKEILRGKIMRKYRLTTHAFKQMRVPMKRGKTTRKGSLSSRLKGKVQCFFERDDNSRTTTGKKQTKTRQRVKKQLGS